MRKRLMFIVFLVSTSVSAGHIANPNYVRLEWYNGGSSVNYKINDAPYSQNLLLSEDNRTDEITKRINEIIEEANQEISTASISSKAVEVDFSKLIVDIGDIDYGTPHFREIESEISDISAKVEKLEASLSDEMQRIQCLSTIHDGINEIIIHTAKNYLVYGILVKNNELRDDVLSFYKNQKSSEKLKQGTCKNIKEVFYADELGLYKALVLLKSEYIDSSSDDLFSLRNQHNVAIEYFDELLRGLMKEEFDSLVKKNLVEKKKTCLAFNTLCVENVIPQSELNEELLVKLNTSLSEVLNIKQTLNNKLFDGIEKFGLMDLYEQRDVRYKRIVVKRGKLKCVIPNYRRFLFSPLDQCLSSDLNNEMKWIKESVIRDEITKKYDLIHGSEIVRILPHVNLINSNQVISDRSDEGSSEVIINNSSMDSGSSAVVY